MRKFTKFLCLFAVCLMPALFGYSQGVTTAAFNGIVLDENGSGLAGATVIAIHEPSGSQYGIIARADGRFDLPAVRTGGPYKVTVSFVGYDNTVLTDIQLDLGQNMELQVKMKPKSVQIADVVIVGVRDPLFNNSRTGASNNVTSDQMSTLPSLSRSFTDMVRLTPQSSGNSFAGRNSLYNNLSIDGSVFNNSFGLASTPGGQTSAQPISLDAIEQIQVSLAPYDVRQSGFTGAGINAVTRSGNNKVSASVYRYWRNQDMVSKKVAGTNVTNANFSQAQTGFRVGGPIIKNKLFFFVSAEREERTDPGTSFVAGAPGLSGPNVSKVLASDLETLKSFLISKFQFDPGNYQGNEMKTFNEKFLVRLDYNISNSHKFSVRYNYLKSWKDQNASTSNSSGGRASGLNSMIFDGSNYKIYNNISSIIGELNSVFSNVASNNLIIGYSQFRDYREGNCSPFPTVDILNGGSTWTSFGFEQYSVNNKLNTDIFQVSDNFTMYLGKHTVTLGGSYEGFKFANGYMPNLYGYYRFNSLQDFYDNVNAVAGRNPGQYVLRYSAIAGDAAPLAKIDASQLGIYIQDEWTPIKRLKLTLGVRIDMPFYPSNLDKNAALDPLNFRDSDGNPEKIDVSKLPKSNPLWSPRLGFNYDLFGDRSTQIRGGVGVFTGRIPFVWISNQASNNGIMFGLISNLSTTAAAGNPFNPDVTKYIPATATLPATIQINSTVNNFKYPQVFRTNFAIDQKLPYGIVGTLEAIYTKDINAVFHRDANLPVAIGKLPDGRDLFPATVGTVIGYKMNQNINGAYVLDNTNQGYSYFITAQLQKSFSGGLNAMIAYTYGVTKDVTSNPGSQASSAFNFNPVVNDPDKPVLGYSAYDQPHKLVASVNYKFNYFKMGSTAFSLVYVGSRSGRYSYTYLNDLNRDGVTGNDLIFIPKTMADINLVKDAVTDARTTDQIWAQIDNYIEQDPYLKKHRGEFAERNGSVYPWTNQFDLRLTQQFYITIAGKKNTFEFTADVINVGNYFNNGWGGYQSVNKTSFLSFKGFDGTGKPTFTMPLNSDKSIVTDTYYKGTGLSSRWQVQFGIRYTFD